MHTHLNKRHIVSPRLSRRLHHHFWQEIRRITVIECPPKSSPQGDINSNCNPNPKDNPNTKANPKVIARWFTLRLSGTLRRDVVHPITCISGHVGGDARRKF